MFLIVIAGAIFGGTLCATRVEPNDPPWARLAAGTVLGLTLHALVGYVLAAWWGLTSFVPLVASAIVAGVPFLLRPRMGAEKSPARKRRKVAAPSRSVAEALPARATRPGWGVILCFVLSGLLLWQFFGRAAYMRDGSLMTGESNNYGDLGVHVGIITGFVKGENFPPEHTELAGTRLTYPFLADFGVALLMASGMELVPALLAQNILLALALVALLYRWAERLTGDRLAALLAPLLVAFNGGLGFVVLFLESAETGTALLTMLGDLTHSYTIVWGDWGELLKWGNPLTTLFITQRAFLLGLPLALAIWTLWWRAHDDAEGALRRRRLLAAGCIAGLLPLAHAHTFLVMMGMGACLALPSRKHWRDWALFFAIASFLALPQIVWSTRGAGASAARFVGWHYGWARPVDSPFSLVAFWAVNLGLSWLGLWALFWRPPLVSGRLRLFLMPFLLCLLVPNFVKLAPWEWDNVKVLLYGYLALVPPLALLVATLLRGTPLSRAVGAFVLVGLTASGALDVWRVVGRQQEIAHFGADVIEQARMIEKVTPPRARILTALSASRPTLLTGRRSVFGVAFHMWSHGMDAEAAGRDARAIFAGGPDAEALLRQHRVDFVLIGAQELAEMNANETYFARFERVGEAGGARLYRIALSAAGTP